MRPVSVMTAVALIVTAFGCASGRPAGTQTQAQAPKQGKVLVKSLPDGIEGVELVGDAVRVKSGFEWVKQPDGTITVARMGSSFGEAGTWSCDCTTGAYSCQGEESNGSLRCVSRDCLSCKLTLTKGGPKTNIIAY